MRKTALFSAITTALLASAGVQAADAIKAVGAGEGRLDIIAWPGYIERGQSDKAYDWVTRFDMSFRYTVPTTFSRYGELVLRADVFNVFNLKAVIENNEFGETDGGSPDPNYKAPVAYQAPRSFRFGFDWQF